MKRSINYWLIKSEPDVYPWEQLVSEGGTFWDGVRNYQARNNLQAMRVGDKALYYHSNTGKEVVGITEISREAYQDPTTDQTAWVAVDVKPYKPFKKPVTLDTIKATPELASLALIKQSQLSVMAITQEEFSVICRMGGVKL